MNTQGSYFDSKALGGKASVMARPVAYGENASGMQGKQAVCRGVSSDQLSVISGEMAK
mgnify:CR=1 FL=1